MELLTPEDVEKILGIHPRSQANRRSKGTFIDYLTVGRRVMYPREALERFVKENLKRSPSQFINKQKIS